MSTGQLLLSSPSFLDIARLRTGLSLVWRAKLKQKKRKIFQTPVKNKRQVSLLKVTDINMKQTNIKNTTVLALTRCPLDWANKENVQQMTGKVLSFHSTNRFCFCSLWQKRKPSRDQETILRQWVSQFLCFHVPSIVNTYARRNEGTSVVASILPGSTFTVSAQQGWKERGR